MMKQQSSIFIPLTGILIFLVLASVGCNREESYKSTVLKQIAPTSDVTADTSEQDESDAFPQKFHVEGNKIVDESGKEIVLRGLAPSAILGLAYRTETGDINDEFLPWGEELFKKMSEWGAKIIRLDILAGSWRVAMEGSADAEGYDKEKAIEIIDQAIKWSSKYNMYVIVDYFASGWPPEDEYGEDAFATSREEIITFWDEISKHYKDNKVVAFYEIFNEPVHSDYRSNSKITKESLRKDWLVWKGFAEKVIDVIRENDPDSVIIVGGLGWSYIISFAAEYPIQRENIVYGTHPYPLKYSKYTSWDNAFGNIKEKYPVFATEFGFNQNAREDQYTGPGRYRDAIKAYLEDKKISWTAWNFSIKPLGFLKDRDYTPNEAGKFFKKWLLEKR